MSRVRRERFWRNESLGKKESYSEPPSRVKPLPRGDGLVAFALASPPLPPTLLGMIDLHTYSALSVGTLNPAALIRYAEVAGYQTVGITDRADEATLPQVLPILLAAAERENKLDYLAVIVGVELTHVRPEHLQAAAETARNMGAQLVSVFGETSGEPTQAGTNRAAISAGADLLSHPSLITPEDAAYAARENVLLEITAAPAYRARNSHVVTVARAVGADLIFGTGARSPEQFCSREEAIVICREAGMPDAEIEQMFTHTEQFAQHKTMQQELDHADDW